MAKKRLYRKAEESAHSAICRYLRMQYPDVIFHSDSSGVKLTMGQATALKKTRSAGEKIPDLFIAEVSGYYSGLYLEIKKDREELYNKAGQIRNSEHINAQKATLEKLNKKGYCAMFAGGSAEGAAIIEYYMKFDVPALRKIKAAQGLISPRENTAIPKIK